MAEGRIVGYVPPLGSNERTKLLRLKVIAGHNLAKKDIFGASDPYTRIDLVTLDGEEVEDSVLTKTKKRTLNPCWEEEFIIRVQPEKHKLVFEVFDENRLTRDDFLGMVELQLNNIQKERDGHNIQHKYYILRPRSARSKVRGHLQLYHAFVADNNDSTSDDGGDQSRSTVDGTSASSQQRRTAAEDDWEVVGNSETAATTIGGSSGLVNEELPASSARENGSAPAGGTLPPGWEERQDANGRTYYVNHVARTTQWQHPGSVDGENVHNEDHVDHRRRVHISMDDTASLNRQSVSGDSDSIIERMHSLSIEGEPEAATPGTPTASGGGGVATQSRPDSVSEVDSGGSSSGDRAGRDRGHVSGQSSSATPSTLTAGSTLRESGGSSASLPSASAAAASGSGGGTPAPKLNPEGLPEGWTMQVAPNGRVFFINHTDKKTTWVDPRTARPSPLPSQSNVPNRRHEDDLGPLPEGWEERVHTDGRIFFIDHNTRQTQWEDPRISNPTIAGPAIPYNRDYKRKYEYLKQQLKKPNNVPNKFEIKVRRSTILEDSYRQIQFPAHKVDILKTKLWIEFDGEVGLDYGGVAREWFYLLSKEMFNPYYGLFEYSATDNYTLQINPNSGLCNEDHLSYFKFIGRVAGMAVYHGKLLDGFFIRPFYKMMLAKTIELKDMESVDTEYFNSMLWIKENDPTELDLTFQVDEESFGRMVTRELKPNGARIPVTDANKDEYIQLVIQWRFVSRVQQQMDNFLAGFNELVPLNLIKVSFFATFLAE